MWSTADEAGAPLAPAPRDGDRSRRPRCRPSALVRIDEVDAGCRRGRAPPGSRARPARRAWRNGWSSSFTARSIVAAASSTLSAIAQTDGAVGDVEGMGEAFLLAVDDDVDVALAPARDVLRLVLARLGEAEPGSSFSKSAAAVWSSSRTRRTRRRRTPRAAAAPAGPATAAPVRRAQLVEHEDQRALPVDRDAARRAGAEAVVEDLEREKPVVAGGLAARP